VKVFLICPVRGVDERTNARIEAYVKGLEAAGYQVHWPARNTRQGEPPLIICAANRHSLEAADEVHVWWDPCSEGSIFDLGMAFAHRKTIRIANRPEVNRTPGKSFTNFLLDAARP
jgi:hypothetical protein